MMMMLDAGSSIAMHGIGEHDQSKMRAPKTSPSLKKTGAKTLHPPGTCSFIQSFMYGCSRLGKLRTVAHPP
jgi:hypothetical protein